MCGVLGSIGRMVVRVGTSGFAYKEWKGSFYPDDLPAAKMLGFYAARFDTVEINNTFYRSPQPSVLAGWASEVRVPVPAFAFALKAPMWITHLKKLEELNEPARQFFAMVVETLVGELRLLQARGRRHGSEARKAFPGPARGAPGAVVERP